MVAKPLGLVRGCAMDVVAGWGDIVGTAGSDSIDERVLGSSMEAPVA
jgi:hypothetical protein